MKVGRLRTPFYYYSEYLEVGYAYNWIKPPVDVYRAQVTNMDGLSFLYNMALGPVDAQLNIAYGNRTDFDDDTPGVTVSDYKPLSAINIQFDYKNITTKLIHTRGKVSYNSAQLDAVTAALTQGANASFRQYAVIEDTDIIVSGIAFDFDFDPFEIFIEYTYNDVEDSILTKDEERFMAAAAYSIGDVTFIYTWSRNEQEGNPEVVGYLPDPNAAIPVGGGQTVTAAQFAQGVVAANYSTSTTNTLGARYDFHDSAALKIEFINNEEDVAKTDANLIRMGVDMIF